ncbi:hypothetical protein AX17_001342 [Amanita inopinata Kibby_2008]|nr:hypothetical protein AX17_001342 [Amanita inopinata Kibby_2008]
MAHVLLLPLQSTRRTDSLALRLVHPRLLLRGFQLYAVEKWLVDRSRPLTLLAVYTGHHDHLLPVAAYTTPDKSSWDNLISFLKRDGARQRETEHGCIMVTSLAHFRSDYTIVLIPDGDFPAVRDHLYTNINLLRMNCSGRSALTLEEPSDTTKERFISTYLIPEFSHPDSRTRDRVLFTATVLELVKLIQAGLSLFGMYAGPSDGLLCDTTVDGIRRWIADIGEPIIGLEPTERIADPMFVSALLSLVLSIRNKLSALGYSQHIPKDPFLQPQTLSNALAAFVQNTSPFIGPSSSNSSNTTSGPSQQNHSQSNFVHTHSFSLPNHPFYSGLTPPFMTSTAPPPPIIVLSQTLIEAIDAAYESKYRSTETRKVRRAIKEKLDDLAGVVAGTNPDNDPDQGTIDASRRGNQSSIDIPGPGDRGGSGTLVGSSSTLGGIASGLGLSGGTGGCSSIVEPTIHLPRFVRTVAGGAQAMGGVRVRGKRSGKRESIDLGLYGYGREKDKDKEAGVGASVRALWSGHINILLKMREWQELSSVDKDGSDKWRDRWPVGASDGEEVERPRSDGRITEEESDHFGFSSSFWGERMQRTLESWTSRRNRRRTMTSLDLSASPSKSIPGSKAPIPQKQVVDSSSSKPTFSGSVIIPPASPTGASDDDDMLLSSGQVSPQASNSFGFSATPEIPQAMSNKKTFLDSVSQRRGGDPKKREASWATTTSARDDFSDVGTSLEEVSEPAYSVCRDDIFVDKRKNSISPDRRRSFHDLRSLQDILILTPEQMRIDVELCSQVLIMLRRQEHLRNIVACLQVLESSLAATSSRLREDYETHLDFITSVDPTNIFSDINAQYKMAEETSQQTKTLLYESKQFSMSDLWHASSHFRQEVFDLRNKVFGTGGRRLPRGVHGAHGRFNRLQWTIDGQKRLVDYCGRMETEVEEETRADHGYFTVPVPEEDEQNVVEHPSMKPVWLLRLFTSWGARWGAATASRSRQRPDTADECGKSSAFESSDVSGMSKVLSASKSLD